MPINMTIQGSLQAVPKSFILSALTSDDKEKAVGARNLWQLITDFFTHGEHRKVIETLWDMVHSQDSSSFQENILKLVDLAEDKDVFKQALQMQVTQKHGNSLVTVFLDESHFAHIEFEKNKNDCEFVPDVRFFHKCKKASSAERGIYILKAKPLPLPNLKPVEDRIAKPGLVESLGTSYKAALKGSIPETSFKEMQDSVGRSISLLPSSNEIEGSDTFSREKFVEELFLPAFSNADELLEISKATVLNSLFLTLTLQQQKDFLTNVATTNLTKEERDFQGEFSKFPEKEQAFLKQVLFTLNPKILVSDEMVKHYQNGLLNLSDEDQIKFPLRFKPLQFRGELSEFKWRLNNLPIQYQALFLINAEQMYKTPLDGFGDAIKIEGALTGNVLHIDKERSVYSTEILERDATKPLEVKIKLSTHHEFHQQCSGIVVEGVLAHQETSAIYTVTFTDDKKLETATIELSEYDLNLVKHDENQVKQDKAQNSCPTYFAQTILEEQRAAIGAMMASL